MHLKPLEYLLILDLEGRLVRGDSFYQEALMQLGPLGKNGSAQSNPEAPTQVAKQVENR